LDWGKGEVETILEGGESIVRGKILANQNDYPFFLIKSHAQKGVYYIE